MNDSKQTFQLLQKFVIDTYFYPSMLIYGQSFSKNDKGILFEEVVLYVHSHIGE